MLLLVCSNSDLAEAPILMSNATPTMEMMETMTAYSVVECPARRPQRFQRLPDCWITEFFRGLDM